jgi:hypothetical protein
MRLTSALLLWGAACSTSNARTPSPDARSTTPFPLGHSATIDVGEQKLIRVAGFDCEKREAFPGLPAQNGLVARANGIRSWHGGGPGGANWNVEDLRCVVRVSTSCERGRLEVVLRVGKAIVAQRQVEIRGTSIDVEIPLSMKSWKPHVDEPIKKVTADLPYKIAAFRAFVAMDCTAPSQMNLKNSSYRDVTDDDAFVAGFASGE